MSGGQLAILNANLGVSLQEVREPMNLRVASLNLFVLITSLYFWGCNSSERGLNSEILARAKAGDAGAQTSIGIAYFSGTVVKKDNSLAVKWFSKAASQGDHKAEMALGTMYQEGLGVSRDKEQAVFWTRKAAEQGFPEAEYRMGDYYSEGYGSAQKD